MNNIHKIGLTTLSPLHIGTGRSLTSVGEFITTNSNVNIIDQFVLNQLLDKHDGLRERYLKHIIEKQENANVFQFFTEENLIKELQFERSIPLHAVSFNADSNNMLELHIDTSGGKYVPGSSIKGALRSLFFAATIMQDPSVKKEVTEIILSPGKKLYPIKKEIQNLEDSFFLNDMKYFMPRDTNFFPEEDICVEIAKREHLFGVDTKGLDTLRECVRTGANTNFELAVNPCITHPTISFLNKKSAIHDMFSLTNKVIEHYIDFETGLLRQSGSDVARHLINELSDLKSGLHDYKNERALIRLGKGKSFYFMIILPFLDEPARNKVLELMKVEPEAFQLYPQTRMVNEENKMFGWVEMTFKKAPVVEKPLVDNKITNLQADVTILTARCTGKKTVSILINGVQTDDVHLVNKFKQPIESGDEIQVIVSILSKIGRVNQVKLINH